MSDAKRAKERPASPAFWKVADQLIADNEAEEGTMMGHPCLRSNGQFFAMVGQDTGHLIVKLTKDRVDWLIAEEQGEPFAPAGRRFKEWVVVPRKHARLWAELMREAKAFVDGVT